MKHAWLWMLAAAVVGCSEEKGPPEVEVPADQIALRDEIRTRGGTALGDKEHPAWGMVNVSLRGTDADDALVQRLAKLPQLQQLNLSATKVTDASVPVLVKIKTLTLLDVSGLKLSEKSKATLRQRFESEGRLYGADPEVVEANELQE